MKHHIIFFSVLFGALFFVLRPAIAQTSITIHFHDGTEQLIAVSEDGKLSFDATNLLIHTADGTVSISLSTLRKITFDKGVSIPDYAKKENIVVYPNPAQTYVRIAGIETSMVNVKIFSVNGQLLLQKECDSNEQIDISSLNSGLYFININNNLIKFIKR